jgi:putative peptide maturation dehydrogenase
VPRFRRTLYAFYAWQDGAFLDIEELLRGAVSLAPVRQLLGISALLGEPVGVTPADVALLGTIPTERWVDAGEIEEVTSDQLVELARQGLLVSDDEAPPFDELRRRDEQLASGQWNVYAALYHGLTRWRDVEVRRPFGAEGPEELAEFVVEHGPPPPAFHVAANGGAIRELPAPAEGRALFDVLARRRTTRVFDRDAPVAEGELSTVLHHVFGYHGHVPVLDEIVALKRTSPSGGGLHPVEAYPLVLRVEGVEPGLYHYRADHHALQLLQPLETDEAERVVDEFTCGQSYFASAAALFVLTARFYRNFWKYRKHQKAYSAVLMDVGHLSQTLYLVCAELGLGAFFTAAVNGANIEERLGLEPFVEGAIAITGCGRRAPGGSPLEPSFIVGPPPPTKGEPEWPTSPK